MERAVKIKVYFSIIFSILFWGFSFVWTKQALEVYSPITVIFFRLTISVIFLYILGKIFSFLKPVEKKDWKKFLLIAFWEPFSYFIGENYGLTQVSPTTASVIIATIPVFSPIAAYYFHKEKITILNFLGILLSVVGVFLVVLKTGFDFKINLKGLLFLFWAVISAVLYTVLVYGITKKYDVFTIVVYQNIFGALMFLPLFIFMEFNTVLATPFVASAWLAIILLAIFASSFAFILFAYGIKHIGISRTNTLLNFIPVFTALFSFLVLGERFSWFNILGIFIVISGVLLAQQRFKITK